MKFIKEFLEQNQLRSATQKNKCISKTLIKYELARSDLLNKWIRGCCWTFSHSILKYKKDIHG